MHDFRKYSPTSKITAILLLIFILVGPLFAEAIQQTDASNRQSNAKTSEVTPDNITIKTIGWIGAISAGLIILFISARSILDVWMASGVPIPSRLSNSVMAQDRKRFLTYLEEVGFVHKVNYTRAMTFWLDRAHLIPVWDNQEVLKRFIQIAQNAVDGPRQITIGDKSQSRVSYYLNIRRVFCDQPECVCSLTELMSAYIRNELRDGVPGQSPTCIISRKTGLDLLGFFTASMLRTRFVLFHDSRSVQRELDFEYLPEGASTMNAIIVDDSCVGGDGILEMATQWKRVNPSQQVVHAFVLFNRSDMHDLKTFTDAMKNHGVIVHALATFDDQDLSMLQKGKYNPPAISTPSSDSNSNIKNTGPASQQAGTQSLDTDTIA